VQQGVPVAIGTQPINNVGQPLLIGKWGSGFNTQAAFDEITIYNTGLSVQEIAQVANSTSPICRTCDYKVEFFLRKLSDPDYVHPNLPAPKLISAGTCGQQASLIWDPVAFNLSGLDANIDYVLEKRITSNNIDPLTNATYLKGHEEAIRSFYQTQIDQALDPILGLNGFLTTNNLTGLYSYLSTNFIQYLYPTV
jgi:hypothetical protein